MRLIFLTLVVITLSFAKSELFLLPHDANDAKEKVIELIEKSNKSIVIAMYNFSYKKFAKALAKAKKRGIHITVVLDKKKIKEDDSIYKYLKSKGIQTLIVNKKMHLKAALFDDEILLLGSANFTKKSFSNNYEILLINDNQKSIKKVKTFIENMK